MRESTDSSHLNDAEEQHQIFKKTVLKLPTFNCSRDTGGGLQVRASFNELGRPNADVAMGVDTRQELDLRVGPVAYVLDLIGRYGREMLNTSKHRIWESLARLIINTIFNRLLEIFPKSVVVDVCVCVCETDGNFAPFNFKILHRNFQHATTDVFPSDATCDAGIAFSRLLTRHLRNTPLANSGRKGMKPSITYGPCQTPALGFCVARQARWRDGDSKQVHTIGMIERLIDVDCMGNLSGCFGIFGHDFVDDTDAQWSRRIDHRIVSKLMWVVCSLNQLSPGRSRTVFCIPPSTIDLWVIWLTKLPHTMVLLFASQNCWYMLVPIPNESIITTWDLKKLPPGRDSWLSSPEDLESKAACGSCRLSATLWMAGWWNTGQGRKKRGGLGSVSLVSVGGKFLQYLGWVKALVFWQVKMTTKSTPAWN